MMNRDQEALKNHLGYYVTTHHLWLRGRKRAVPLDTKDLHHIVIPTATSSQDQRRAYQENIENVQSLRFLFVHATRRFAAILVVRSYERKAIPLNGMEAWLELERIYRGARQMKDNGTAQSQRKIKIHIYGVTPPKNRRILS